MAIMIVNQDRTWHELIYDAMMENIDQYIKKHEGVNPPIDKTNIRKMYIKSIKYFKALKSIIIKKLSTRTYSHPQNTHFIEINLLKQTTYYKLNTTRP